MQKLKKTTDSQKKRKTNRMLMSTAVDYTKEYSQQELNNLPLTLQEISDIEYGNIFNELHVQNKIGRLIATVRKGVAKEK